MKKSPAPQSLVRIHGHHLVVKTQSFFQLRSIGIMHQTKPRSKTLHPVTKTTQLPSSCRPSLKTWHWHRWNPLRVHSQLVWSSQWTTSRIPCKIRTRHSSSVLDLTWICRSNRRLRKLLLVGCSWHQLNHLPAQQHLLLKQVGDQRINCCSHPRNSCSTCRSIRHCRTTCLSRCFPAQTKGHTTTASVLRRRSSDKTSTVWSSRGTSRRSKQSLTIHRTSHPSHPRIRTTLSPWIATSLSTMTWRKQRCCSCHTSWCHWTIRHRRTSHSSLTTHSSRTCLSSKQIPLVPRTFHGSGKTYKRLPLTRRITGAPLPCEKHTEQQTFSSRFHTWAKDQYLVFGLSSKNNSIPLQFTLQLL